MIYRICCVILMVMLVSCSDKYPVVYDGSQSDDWSGFIPPDDITPRVLIYVDQPIDPYRKFIESDNTLMDHNPIDLVDPPRDLKL